MKVYMEVTKDEYELPLAIADTAQALAKKCNTTPMYIYSAIAHEQAGVARSRFKRVDIDDD